jgi:prevent-host-death family protein
MTQVNVYQAKTELSSLLERAEKGEEIIIAKNGKPKAKLVSLGAQPKSRRQPEFGFWDHYGYRLPENFDDPDPEIEALFNGEDE